MRSRFFPLVLALLPACAATRPIVHEAWTGEIAPTAPAAIAAEPAKAEPLPAAPVQAEGDLNQIALHLGLRQYDDDLEPVDEHIAFALEYTSQNSDAIVGWEGGVSYSQDEDDVSPGGVNIDFDLAVWELWLGVHKSFFDVGSVRPFVGAGVTYIKADIEASVGGGGGTFDDDDDVFGFYVHGGVGMNLSESLEIGADARAIFADDFDVLSSDAASDYLQGSIFLGLKI